VAIDPETGIPRTRWGGQMMTHAITGEKVPDPDDRVLILKYVNPRPAEWFNADYIVSNPPFIGNARMREVLGDGYAEALRQVYDDVPDTVDYVMYWWHKAAELTRLRKTERFGLITTNSIRQIRLRGVVDFHLNQKNALKLTFIIPDHPWTEEGAAVRISMTCAELDNPKRVLKFPQVGTVVNEREGNTPEDSAEQVKIKLLNVGRIFSNLQFGADVSKTVILASNNGLASQGFVVGGAGFVINAEVKNKLELQIIHPFITGRDITQASEQRFAIDVNHLSESEFRVKYPKTYQWLLQTVKPERNINNDSRLKREWWRYRRSNASIRNGVKQLSRYIATTRTAKHRVFQFFNSNVMAESGVVMIFLEDAYYLGILSSKVHIAWTLAQGSVLEDRPVYNHASCFYTFPFPDPAYDKKQKILEIGEKLDAHRKQVQAQHPDVTITGMYNLLEKLRRGEQFTDHDRAYNNKALVSILKQIHDELDAAVFDAYGWESDISDEEILKRLVALNAQRAEEERNGLIRWLRPEYQAPNEVQIQQTIAGVAESEDTPAEATQLLPWSKKPREQLTAIRDLLSSRGGEWTVDQIVLQFKGGHCQKKIILEHLEALEALGILLGRTEENALHWHYVGLQKIA